MQKSGQLLFTVQIHTVQRGLLCYQDQLPYALVRQLFGFLNETLHGNAAVIAPDLRNNTVGAVFVTAFCNFQILKMSACSDNTVGLCHRGGIDIFIMILFLACKDFLQGSYDFINSSCSDNGVHLRDLLLDFLTVTLCQTTCCDQCFDLSAVLQFSHLQ